MESMKIFDLMSERKHEQLVFWNEPELGYRGIIAIHDTTLGPSTKKTSLDDRSSVTATARHRVVSSAIDRSKLSRIKP